MTSFHGPKDPFRGPKGRFQVLREYATKLNVLMPHDDVIKEATTKRIHNHEDANHVILMMSVEGLLRSDTLPSREKVWKTYASRQHERTVKNLKYLEYLRNRPSRSQRRKMLKEGSVTPDEKKALRSHRARSVDTTDTSVTCCYGCTRVIHRDDNWYIATLTSSISCFEIYNLRIVCQRCHLDSFGEGFTQYACSRGSYHCAKGVAVLEDISSLGKAFMVYYDQYGGRHHDKKTST